MLNEAGLLIKPKQKTKEEEKKEKENAKKGQDAKKQEEQALVQEVLFLEKDVEAILEPVQSFDQEWLGYFDFLEAIVRVVDAYPFNQE